MDRRSSRPAIAAVLSAALCAALLPAAPASAWPRPGQTERVSRAHDGGPVDGSSTHPKLSGDGRLIVFESTASNVLPGDDNEEGDIFVHDRVTGETRFAAPIAEGRTTRWRTIEGTLSRDGRYVVFVSLGRIFLGEHIGGVYITDLHTGTTELVSVRDDGTPSQNGQHFLSNVMTAISADNRYVVFMSNSTDLVPGFTPAISGHHIYVRDLVEGRTELISVSSDGTPSDMQNQSPGISADGRYVAWETRARLVDGDIGGAMKVYLRDRETGTTELISVGYDGSAANDNAWRPRISADGRFVVFETTAFNLVPRDIISCCQSDVFVRDRLLGTTERLSVTSAGSQINGSAFRASMSEDGRHVAFWSDAPNLVPGKPPFGDVYVRDMVTGRTELVSLAHDGGFGNSSSQVPGISADGGTVSWFGWASNLTADHDGTGFQHVHVRERGPTLGSYGVDVSVHPEHLAVAGAAGFAGDVVSQASDPAGDVDPTFATLGADLTRVSLAWRPETGDVLVRWQVTDFPPVDAPDVVYGLRFRAGTRIFEVRAQGITVPNSSQNGDYGLFECAPACVRVADLSGGYGTVGAEVQSSIPVAAAGGPSALESLEAYTAQAQGNLAPFQPLDSVTLPSASLPVPQVRMGIAPVGAEPEAMLDVPLTDGRFAASLDTRLLSPGPHEVVVRSCLGACATDRYAVEVGPGPVPGGPVVDLPTPGQVLGTSNVTIAGTAHPLATVRVRQGSDVVATTMSAEDGSWSVAAMFPPGEHTILVDAANTAGIFGPAVSRSFRVDLTVPVDVAFATDPIRDTVVDNVRAGGTSKPGSALTVTLSDGSRTTAPVTTTVATDGTWSVTGIDSRPLANGDVRVAVSAVDPDGNEGAAVRWVSKSTSALPPGVEVAHDGFGYVGPGQHPEAIAVKVTNRGPEPSATVGVEAVDAAGTLTDLDSHELAMGQSKTLSLDATSLVDGPLTFTAKVGVASSWAVVTLDRTPPEVTMDVSPPFMVSVPFFSTVRFSGTASDATSPIRSVVVELRQGSTVHRVFATRTSPNAKDTTWQANFSHVMLNPGQWTVEAHSMDEAGNRSPTTSRQVPIL